MFLRSTIRKKNGKEHRYCSVVENRRVAGGRVVQRHVLYLGEINDIAGRAWRKTIEVFDEERPSARARWRCSRRIAAMGVLPDAVDRPAEAVGNCRCIGRGNGVACWLALRCGSSLGWIGSGPSVCRPAARARAGIRCCGSGDLSVAGAGQRVAAASGVV